jgi:hypothetical protein
MQRPKLVLLGTNPKVIHDALRRHDVGDFSEAL